MAKKSKINGTEEIAPWLAANIALQDGQSPIPRNYIGVSQSHVTPTPGDLKPLASAGTGTYMHMHTHIHITKSKINV